MKAKLDFVTNSSSTAYIITNTSDRELTLVDFVKENPQLVEMWNEQYDYSDTQEELIESARRNNETFKPGYGQYTVFGDEDGTLIGKIFDYILRDGGTSKNFMWRFEEWQR